MIFLFILALPLPGMAWYSLEEIAAQPPVPFLESEKAEWTQFATCLGAAQGIGFHVTQHGAQRAKRSTAWISDWRELQEAVGVAHENFKWTTDL